MTLDNTYFELWEGATFLDSTQGLDDPTTNIFTHEWVSTAHDHLQQNVFSDDVTYRVLMVQGTEKKLFETFRFRPLWRVEVRSANMHWTKFIVVGG